jgi:2-amino-4-hydroxy-6-hydroxymethyldihydropteridine diphosphokinase
MTATVYLGLGSNVDAAVNIASGISALRATFSNLTLSPVYRTRAVGFKGDDFLNLAAGVETDMSPLELKHWLHELEDRHGRARDVPKYSDRTLDIDILLFEDLYLISPQLEIPRAEILTAAHVLQPLADLAPDILHPSERRTIREIWDAFDDRDVGLEAVEI